MSQAPDLDPCCAEEARRSLRAHRDVAVCDGCGRLLLAWDNAREQELTREELTRAGVSFSEGRAGALYVTAKERAG